MPASPALLVVHTNTFFVEQFRLAKLLRATSRFEPTVMLYPYPTAERDAALAWGEGIRCVDDLGRPMLAPRIPAMVATPPTPIRFGRLKYVATKLLAVLRNSRVAAIWKQLDGLRSRTRWLGQFLADTKPEIVVLGGDMVGYDTSLFVKAAHQRGIPVAVVPSTMSNGLEQAEVYFDNPDHWLQGWLNLLAAFCFPKWVTRHKGRRLLRERGARIIAMELFGVSPPRPWIFNSGFADAIATESHAMQDYYVAAGLGREKLVVTGSPSDDAMSAAVADRIARRRRLCESLDLPVDRPLLLSALPPDFLYVVGGRPQCDFKEYAELVQFWVDGLRTAKRYNKVLCLHPSVDPETMKYLQSEDLRIAKLPTAELVPLCDLYVACVSSTIRWAIACGIPVINYDVYRYRYTDYMGVDAVKAVEEQSEFLEELQKLTNDDAYYAQVAARQRAIRERWGTLDGKSGERIVALFEHLTENTGARLASRDFPRDDPDHTPPA
jgi:hypothetical protein